MLCESDSWFECRFCVISVGEMNVIEVSAVSVGVDGLKLSTPFRDRRSRLRGAKRARRRSRVEVHQACASVVQVAVVGEVLGAADQVDNDAEADRGEEAGGRLVRDQVPVAHHGEDAEADACGRGGAGERGSERE